jgi:drug/metabolite transporter (DMT)-like permease
MAPQLIIPAFLFRLFLLMMLVSVMLYLKKPIRPKSDKFPWLLLSIIGLFDICAFFSYSLGVSNAFGSIVAPISSANTLITILLGILILKEKMSQRQLVGIGAIISGLVLIAI